MQNQWRTPEECNGQKVGYMILEYLVKTVELVWSKIYNAIEVHIRMV